MSFPRAKLQRFNEKQSSTPSPADYNPKIKSRVGGAVISQTERFTEPRSPALSDSVSILSANSSACFRTPTLIRKKKSIKTAGIKQKSIDLFTTTDDKEALQDKIVECNNKDLYIKELTEQIEEMKLKVSNLENQTKQLTIEKNKFENKTECLKREHKVELDNISLKKSDEILAVNNRLNEVNTQLQLMQKDYDEFQQLYSTTVEIHNKEVMLKKEIAESKGEQVCQLENNLAELQKFHAQEIDELNVKHKREFQVTEIEMLKTTNKLQRELEQEKLNFSNIISELTEQKVSEISSLQKLFEEEKGTLKNQCEAQIKQIEENCKEANLLAEMQMQEKIKDLELTWKIKLEDQEKQAEAILKECQAISEYNIIQCELEKNNVKHQLFVTTNELEEMKEHKLKVQSTANEIEETYQNLKSEFDQVTVELNQVREKLKKEKDVHEYVSRQAASDKHAYEVTIEKTHKTIEALKRRLFDSDKDVEQLKAELEGCEMSKLEFESKCNSLSDQLELALKMNEDLELQNESTLKTTEEKIQNIQEDLHQKVENYKQIADETVKKVNDKLEQKTAELKEVLEQLHLQQVLNSEAQSLIQKVHLENEHLESLNTDYKFANDRLKLSLTGTESKMGATNERVKDLEETNKILESKLREQVVVNNELRAQYEASKLKNEEVESLMRRINQLQEKNDSYYQYCEYYKSKAGEYEREIEDMNKINKKYIDQSGKYDDLIQKHEALVVKNSKLEMKVAEQESLIGPFRQQLEAFELECSALQTQKCDAEAEARLIGMKYAEILGHQNQKQKIKHMIDLKRKNNELIEGKLQLELKIRSQAKSIEKLKKELAAFKKSPRKQIANADKENVNSPNHALNSNIVSSPLRDRN